MEVISEIIPIALNFINYPKFRTHETTSLRRVCKKLNKTVTNRRIIGQTEADKGQREVALQETMTPIQVNDWGEGTFGDGARSQSVTQKHESAMKASLQKPPALCSLSPHR